MTARTNIRRIGISLILLLVLMEIYQIGCERQVSSAKSKRAEQILDESGVEGGFIVHIGCGNGRLTAALCANDSYLVHGLDANAKNIQWARKHIKSQNLYGRVSVEQFKGNRLPYADNLVNLIVSERATEFPKDEIMRILAPNGVAFI